MLYRLNECVEYCCEIVQKAYDEMEIVRKTGGKNGKRVALLCDSSADISEAEAKELGIHVLRMPIIIDNETFTEGVDIFDEDILKALKADKKISTTQPSPGSMLALWGRSF